MEMDFRESSGTPGEVGGRGASSQQEANFTMATVAGPFPCCCNDVRFQHAHVRAHAAALRMRRWT